MIPPMDVDAAQYASMSLEMLGRGDFLSVYDLGKDYLDKPPFLFWINSLSMYLFGANLFAFKFPSLLFAVLAIYSTYKLAGILYNKGVAIISSVVLASSQCLFLITNDIRTDTILMGWVIFSLWQLISWVQTKKIINFILGFAAIGGGMLTKGPIALLVPVFALGSHFLIYKKYSFLFRREYLVGLIIITIVLLPMSIGLYHQFDLHPEKLVSNKYNVSGLLFFYWTQSFGRITGESVWDNNAGLFYLLQNMLWSFLPWIIFFLIAVIIIFKRIFNNKFRFDVHAEYYTIGGFLLTYTSLALSNYQLPHYIFVVFPLAAIITGNLLHQLYFEESHRKLSKILFTVHRILFAILWLGLVALIWRVFDTIHVYAKILCLGSFAWFLVIMAKTRFSGQGLMLLALYTIIGINFFLSTWFYPSLLKFQMGSEIGKYITRNQLPVNKIFAFKTGDRHSLSFYSGAIIPELKELNGLSRGNYVLTGEDGLRDIETNRIVYKIIENGKGFHVSTLTGKFINPATREEALKKYYLILLE